MSTLHVIPDILRNAFKSFLLFISFHDKFFLISSADLSSTRVKNIDLFY